MAEKSPGVSRRSCRFWRLGCHLLPLQSGSLQAYGECGLRSLPTGRLTPKLELLNRLKADGPRVWDDEPFDAIPFYTAVEYPKEKKPRILYLSLGETDDWAHGGRYREYLDSAHRVDSYVKALWDLAQSLPEYRANATLIFLPDHGRGKAPHKWKDHGQKIPDSKYIWIAFLGPDTPALGERTRIHAVTQGQIAATLAAFFGEDYVSAVPKAGNPIADVIPH